MPKRAVLIVDGANWSHRLSDKNARLDYDRLVSKIEQATDTQIIGLLYYTAYRTQEDLNRRHGFFQYLKNLGWQVQVMPATQDADGHWRDKEVDIAIALDAYEEAISGSVDTILIGSGDEDFGALFRRLPENVDGWMVGFRQGMTKSVKDFANVLFLDDLGVLRSASTAMGSDVD